jgi:hypothetical protein
MKGSAMCGTGVRRQATTILVAGLALTAGCSRRPSGGPQDSSGRPFWSDLTPQAAFTLADELECRTVLSTHQPFVNTTFKIIGLTSEKPVAVGQTKQSAMSVLQSAGKRLVLQVAGEDPGSVVTLSLDKGTGAFALQWSGWDPNGKLSVGAQRGFCHSAHGGTVSVK